MSSSVSLAVPVAVSAESRPGERRVALVPELAGRLRARGFSTAIAAGAGHNSFFPDALYRNAAVRVTPDPVEGAQVLLSVRPPAPEAVRATVLLGDAGDLLREAEKAIAYQPD